MTQDIKSENNIRLIRRGGAYYTKCGRYEEFAGRTLESAEISFKARVERGY